MKRSLFLPIVMLAFCLLGKTTLAQQETAAGQQSNDGQKKSSEHGN